MSEFLSDDELKEFLKHDRSEDVDSNFEQRVYKQMSADQDALTVHSIGSQKRILQIFIGVSAVVIVMISIWLVTSGVNKIDLLEGHAIIQHDRVLTEQSKALVRLPDRTTVELKENTEFKLSSRRQLEFVKGSAIVDVAKDGPFSVRAPQASVKVLGTKFELRFEGQSLLVRVIKGKVLIENYVGSEILQAGDLAACKVNQKPVKQEDTLHTLKKLIRQLGDDDPQVRDKAQGKILEIIKTQAVQKSDIKNLVDEIKREKKESKDEEVKARLEALIDRLISIECKGIKEAPISGRDHPTTVLLGNKLVVWGGCVYKPNDKMLEDPNPLRDPNPLGDPSPFLIVRCSDGVIYDVDKNEWTKIKEAPISGRWGYDEALLGNKLVIWQGYDGKSKFYGDGAIFDVEKNEWTKMKGSPISRRMYHTRILLGNKLVIWGGFDDSNGSKLCNDGAIFYIEKNEWTKIKEAPIGGRMFHTGILLGNKLVIWGGYDGSGGKSKCYGDGAIFDLEKNKWTKIKEAPISGRYNNTGVLVDNKLVIWGGLGGSGPCNDGAIYDIEKNEWTKMKEAPISGRDHPTTVLLGNKLVVWGGCVYKPNDKMFEDPNPLRNPSPILSVYCSDGAIYDIDKNEWTKIKEAPISGRDYPTTVLLGNKLVIWEGFDGSKYCSDGAIFDVEKNEWTGIKESPIQGRSNHTKILLGNKLIIWGGVDRSMKFCNDGAICNLEKNEWTKLKEAPISGRYNNTGVLVDNKLVIWGGLDRNGRYCNDGAIYELPIID